MLNEMINELEWILHQSECEVLFYDAMQVVGPSGIDLKLYDDFGRFEFEDGLKSVLLPVYNAAKDCGFSNWKFNGANTRR